MRKIIPAIAFAALATASFGAFAAADISWDGTWTGKWGGQADSKLVIKNGKVTEYDFMGKAQKGLGDTVISGDTLSFGTPPYFSIVLTRGADGKVKAHYHTESDADADMTKK